MVERLVIEQQNEAKIAEWCRNRGGVRVWRNAEIGSSYPAEMLTPADSAESPGWRYPAEQSRIVQSGDVDVEVIHVRESWHGSIKRYYWGMGLTEASERKAERIRQGHGVDCKFSWRFDDAGKVLIEVYNSSTRPINMEG